MRARFVSLWVVVVVCGGGVCIPQPDDPPDDPKPPEPFEVSVQLDPAAPGAPDDPPETDGILPQGTPEHVAVFDLGLVPITDGRSPDIFVDVTGGVGGFMVYVYGHEGTRVVLERVSDPSGTLAVSDVEPADLPPSHVTFARGFPAQMYSTNRVLGSTQNGAFLVPNTPKVSMKKGRWTVHVGQYAVDVNVNPPTKEPVDRPVRVVVLARPETPARGALKLAIHLSGSDGLSAATAADDPFLQNALSTLTGAYSQVDVDVTDIAYVDIEPSMQVLTLEEDQCEGGQLADAFASGGAPAGYVPLFLVDRFSCNFGETDVGPDIGGIAGGIPGPAWVIGSDHAGVAVSTAFASRDPNELGTVMAHELGHFLGLYHTRESAFFGNNPITDEIPDTASDVDGARANLMYFATDDSTVLTDGQGAVIRTSPWVEPR